MKARLAAIIAVRATIFRTFARKLAVSRIEPHRERIEWSLHANFTADSIFGTNSASFLFADSPLELRTSERKRLLISAMGFVRRCVAIGRLVIGSADCQRGPGLLAWPSTAIFGTARRRNFLDCHEKGTFMSERKPVPYQPATNSRRCPVCDKPSYSASGVHPQCSLAQADAVSRAARKAEEQTAAVAPAPPKLNRFQKQCPKCKRVVAPRRFRCDCGHNFDASLARAKAKAT